MPTMTHVCTRKDQLDTNGPLDNNKYTKYYTERPFQTESLKGNERGTIGLFSRHGPANYFLCERSNYHWNKPNPFIATSHDSKETIAIETKSLFYKGNLIVLGALLH